MFLAQTSRKKIFCFDFLIQLFSYLVLDTWGFFLYYKGILAFIFNILWLCLQGILCNK